MTTDKYKSLYEITGNVIDTNTVLINRNELKKLIDQAQYYMYLRNDPPSALAVRHLGVYTDGPNLDRLLNDMLVK